MMLTKDYLEQLFKIAVKNALPSECMPLHLKNIDASNGLCILGAGKAAVGMAQTINDYFKGKCSGAIVTRYGYTKQSTIGKIRILKASHPIPDQGSVSAAKEILRIAKKNPVEKPVVFLISGGGSALLSLPIDGLSLHRKIKINKFLIGCGASIKEINVVRKRLSQIKGNKLAEAVKGKYSTLIISDVVGDDPSLIASGPTVTNHSSNSEAISILTKYGWKDITFIKKLLENNSTNNQQISTNNKSIIIANAEKSINKSIQVAINDGYSVKVISYTEEGEARIIAKKHAEIVLKAVKYNKPTIFFSGGELTVTLNSSAGSGGPNQEYLLALAIELKGVEGISALACDTDGIDGIVDVAGAYIDHDTLKSANRLNLEPTKFLKENNSYGFFHQLKAHIVTGPTHTNVNDFRVILVNPVEN